MIMTRPNTCSAIALFMGGLLFVSCNSPLSDTNVTDSSLIQPVFVVAKSVDNNGARSVDYSVDIYDKNANLVTLQNGGVKLNGYQMNIKPDLIGGEFYDLSGESELRFTAGTTYTFSVTLADGSQYNGTVQSQSVDLYEFDVPSAQSRTQDLIVRWRDTDPSSRMTIELTVYSRTDSSEGNSSTTLDIPNPQAGIFTIPATQLSTNQGTTYKADVTLISEKSGSVDPHFMSGSAALSRLTYTRTVALN